MEVEEARSYAERTGGGGMGGSGGRSVMDSVLACKTSRNFFTVALEDATASAVAVESWAICAMDFTMLSVFIAWSESCSDCWSTFLFRLSMSPLSFWTSASSSGSLWRWSQAPLPWALLPLPWFILSTKEWEELQPKAVVRAGLVGNGGVRHLKASAG